MSTMRERVRLITDPAYTPHTAPSRAARLKDSLVDAEKDARRFALSLETTDRAQRLRWLALADTIAAAANSLDREVAI
jgi:hypothetical protein